MGDIDDSDKCYHTTHLSDYFRSTLYNFLLSVIETLIKEPVIYLLLNNAWGNHYPKMVERNANKKKKRSSGSRRKPKNLWKLTSTVQHTQGNQDFVCIRA